MTKEELKVYTVQFGVTQVDVIKLSDLDEFWATNEEYELMMKIEPIECYIAEQTKRVRR